MCMGESGGFCSNTERHLRAHSLWWQASEQGNEHAALLIGDAYYYGRVSFFLAILAVRFKCAIHEFGRPCKKKVQSMGHLSCWHPYVL